MDELTSIREILARLEKLLYGFNYECYFQFELLVETTDLTTARHKLNSTYDLTWQKDQGITPISHNEFKEDINDKLNYRGHEGAGVSLSEEQEKLFQQEVSNLWTLIERKFNPNKTDIFIHPEIYTWIFWGFCFLIVSNEEDRVYLFEGLSSD
ncbi:hypothetical protein [Rufibacter hautae]|uniref:Uncharacterized protein n=1 Tax=Rufibacter hautae TaxID=2595005 RepID=A0A5B6TEH8_9BACT|nr:hypothetical protein [Rufibacter hautae]KAA3437640.1 hypothetical protein FOA19_10040 [Rufibacter hautae]